MFANTEADREFRIPMRYPMCNFDTVKKLKNCQRLFLFQKLDEQGQKIKESIFNKAKKIILRKFMYQLEKLHLQYEKSIDESAYTYLSKDNIISLFLLST